MQREVVPTLYQYGQTCKQERAGSSLESIMGRAHARGETPLPFLCLACTVCVHVFVAAGVLAQADRPQVDSLGCCGLGTPADTGAG